MSFMNDASRANIPTHYCRIFSEHVLKVANKLGFEPEAFLFRENCIFVLIPPGTRYNFKTFSGKYCYDSYQNLNINGFDYLPEMTEFALNTEIGYRNNFYNRKLFPKLDNLEQQNDPLAISKHYTNCTFNRKIRFNKIMANIYANVASYNTLADYLKVILADGIYHSSVTGQYCIGKLLAWGFPANESVSSLTPYREYNWLEYLKITTPLIDIKLFLAEDSATMAELERQIEQHFIGMFLLDYIYQL